jgi:glyoxylase-like metal-dependent hydrolase (beta-lactamase superfamily II)
MTTGDHAMRLLAARCGDIHVDVGLLEGGGLTGASRRVPSMCFVLDHPEGLAIWDTSMHPAVCTDPVGHWGPLAERVIVPEYHPYETLPARLELLGIPTRAVRFILNSHLHNDHCGMNRFFPEATVLVRRCEYEHAVGRMDDPFSGYVRADFYGDGQRLELFDYEDELDLFGDGRVRLLSTIGHTPGHQSLSVTFPSGRCFVLSGDAFYTSRQLEARRPAGLTADLREAERSACRLADLGSRGATVLVQHEPALWAGVATVAPVWEER